MFRLFDTLRLALERLWLHRILVIWVLIGLSAATTLALSLPLYVDAVNNSLLTSHLDDPPYAFRFRYIGSWEGNITRDDVAAVSAVTGDYFVTQIELPLTQATAYVRGDTLTVRLGDHLSLGAFGVGALDGVENQIAVVAGDWPPDPAVSSAAGDPLPVLLSENLFYTTGVQVGDKLRASRPGGQTFELQVAALWRPLKPDDPAWIFPPKFFDEVLLLRPDDLWTVSQGVERPVQEAAWYLVFDGGEVTTSDVQALVRRIEDAQQGVSSALPGIRLDISPAEGLKAFDREARRLMQQLIIIILPVGGLIFYFVSLVAGLLAVRQQPEDVILRSRGMSRRGLLGTHLLMWLTLAGTALVVGLIAAPGVVRLIGQTTAFLRFDNKDEALSVNFTLTAVLAGTLTALVMASSGLYTAWRSSRQTITSFRQRVARASTAWWQRRYLDLMLLVPAGYVLYTLWKQGGLVASAEDPFNDPLIFLGPSLFALGFTLLFLRLWPHILRLGAGIAAYGQNIAVLMALRELTRSIGRYRGTLLMMCFTLSLTGFTASMASTIDRSLEDAVNYKIGADVVLVVATEAEVEQADSEGQGGSADLVVTGYHTLPISDLLAIDGVVQASPVGRYPARLVLATEQADGVMLGVDRASIAAVTHFRTDYAGEPLADLFNKLAGHRTGVLLSARAAREYNLYVGQEINVEVSALGAWYTLRVPVIALLDYFPTLDPREEFFLITNLEPIFEAVGTPLPHNFWLSLAPDADRAAVRRQLRSQGVPVLQWLDTQAALHVAQTAPSRRGVLGFLSVGFAASTLLTLICAIVQSEASFRAQAAQLGSLRAMGLGRGAMGAYLIQSQGIIVFSGILGGTLIGLGMTLLFLPLLDFSGGLPPYLVRVAWDEISLIYGLLAGSLLLATLVAAVFLGRERLITVVKLGDV